MNLLKTNKISLTKTDRQIISLINEKPLKLIGLSINDFADITFCSKTTISRFVRKFGYRDYKAFIIDMNYRYHKYNDQNNQNSDNIIETIIKQEQFALENINIQNRDKVISQSVNAIKSANRIILFGMGSSNLAAQELHHNLSKLGFFSFCDPSADRMIPIVASITSNDLLIVISKSANHPDIDLIINRVHKKQAKIIMITSNSNHNFDKVIDFGIIHGNEEQIIRTGALSSKISQNAIVDLIYNVLVHKSEELKNKVIEIRDFYLEWKER